MNYTKAQGHRIYKKALNYFTKGECFLCHAIQSALGVTWEYPDYFLKDFPEIWKHRPKGHTGNVWFDIDDREKRMTILRKAIQQTKPKPKKK